MNTEYYIKKNGFVEILTFIEFELICKCYIVFLETFIPYEVHI